MNAPTASMRELAQQLLEMSLSDFSSSTEREVPRVHEAAEAVCETIRATLTKLAGPTGVQALLRRALALARMDIPELQCVEIGPEGRIEGLERIPIEERESEAAVALTAHLLALLVTLIGEPLTVIMLREGWPQLGSGLDYKSGNARRKP